MRRTPFVFFNSELVITNAAPVVLATLQIPAGVTYVVKCGLFANDLVGNFTYIEAGIWLRRNGVDNPFAVDWSKGAMTFNLSASPAADGPCPISAQRTGADNPLCRVKLWVADWFPSVPP